jgi:hypothetical protein
MGADAAEQLLRYVCAFMVTWSTFQYFVRHQVLMMNVSMSMLGEMTLSASLRVSKRTKALFFWDHLLSLSREIELVWRGKFHLANILYFVTRYITFVSLVLGPALTFDPKQA